MAREVKCPACGGANPPDGIFCGNPDCRKALGEFRYVSEEIAARLRWHERIAERVAAFVGNPHFIVVHGLWFVLWVVLNTGVLTAVAAFDAYPYSLLGIILAIEAIFITGFLLISSNRQAAHADTRAELDYEVNVKTYRRLGEIDRMLRARAARIQPRVTRTRHERRPVMQLVATLSRQLSSHLVRLSLAVVLAWIGALKFADPAPVVGLLNASLPLFAFEGFVYLLGVLEVAAAVLVAAGLALPYAGMLLSGLFAGTLTIFVIAPAVTYGEAGFPFLSLAGEFLLKDLVLFAVSFALIGAEAPARAVARAPRTVAARA